MLAELTPGAAESLEWDWPEVQVGVRGPPFPIVEYEIEAYERECYGYHSMDSMGWTSEFASCCDAVGLCRRVINCPYLPAIGYTGSNQYSYVAAIGHTDSNQYPYAAEAGHTETRTHYSTVAHRLYYSQWVSPIRPRRLEPLD